jgi:hypothetical protein
MTFECGSAVGTTKLKLLESLKIEMVAVDEGKEVDIRMSMIQAWV